MDLTTLGHTKTEKIIPWIFGEYFLYFGVKLTKNHGFPLIYKGKCWYRL